jgi:putative Mn2+ efflux pump MntP
MKNDPEEMKVDQIEKLVRRPVLYNNVDGVGELGLGLFGLGCGLLDWLQIRNPANYIWHRWWGMLWFWLIIAVIYYGTKAIKTHITYPRTGFVEYRKRKSAWLSALVLGCATALLAAWCATFAARSHWNIGGPYWAMAICSVVIAMLPTGVIGVVAGSTSDFTTLPANYRAWILTITVYGAIMLISGGISFVLYMRHTQPAAETAK